MSLRPRNAAGWGARDSSTMHCRRSRMMANAFGGKKLNRSTKLRSSDGVSTSVRGTSNYMGIAPGIAGCLTVLLLYLCRSTPSFAADQPNTGPQAQAPEQSQSSSTKPKPKSAELEEVLVTGTRLNLTPAEATQQIQVFTQEDIERSGQSTAADFLNTLPVTSLIVDPGSLQTVNAATGVRLRGLPLGTTLVLIDGRRVGISGGAAYDDIFDLTNIPLAAVDRIEVLPQGSSAVYGSDAIAGVVNIILKKNFEGFAGAVRYGAADETHEVNTNLAWGKRWE